MPSALGCGTRRTLAFSPTISGAYCGPRKPGPYAAELKNRKGAMLTKPGSSASSRSSSLATSEPSDGYWIGPVGGLPVCIWYVARP